MGVLLQVHLSQAFLIQMGQTTGRGTPLAAVTLKCRFRLTGERLPLHSGYTCPQGLKGERGHRKTLKNAPSITSANIKHAWREYGHSKHARKAHNAFFLVSVVCTAVLVVLLKCCIPHLCGLFHSFHKKHLSSKFPTKLHSHGKGGGGSQFKVNMVCQRQAFSRYFLQVSGKHNRQHVCSHLSQVHTNPATDPTQQTTYHLDVKGKTWHAPNNTNEAATYLNVWSALIKPHLRISRHASLRSSSMLKN